VYFGQVSVCIAFFDYGFTQMKWWNLFFFSSKNKKLGCWLALGATHYTFHREIAMFANYEMRVNVASWDEKWV
jgi:cephalosporin-C deacetylase-like acetyl esterase